MNFRCPEMELARESFPAKKKEHRIFSDAPGCTLPEVQRFSAYWPIGLNPLQVSWVAPVEAVAGVTNRTTLSSTAQNSFTPEVLTACGVASIAYWVVGVPLEPTAENKYPLFAEVPAWESTKSMMQALAEVGPAVQPALAGPRVASVAG